MQQAQRTAFTLQGKTFAWWKYAAKAFPDAQFAFKSDSDTTINWPALARELRAVRANTTTTGGSGATLPFLLVGHRLGFEACGKGHYCPPPGCQDFNASSQCWVSWVCSSLFQAAGVKAQPRPQTAAL